jgi:hypothetical protein
MKIVLGDFIQIWEERIFSKRQLGITVYVIKNLSVRLHRNSNDNCVRIIKFAIFKNLVVESTMFPQRNLRMCVLISHEYDRVPFKYY